MEYSAKEKHSTALKKIVIWQLLLLITMGFIYIISALLILKSWSGVYYIDISYYIFMGVLGTILAWIAYIWSSLLRSILAFRAYFRSNKEEALIKAYQQQRLFWRSTAIILGVFLVFVASLFIFPGFL